MLHAASASIGGSASREHPLQALEQGLRKVVTLRLAGQHRRRQLHRVAHQHRLRNEYFDEMLYLYTELIWLSGPPEAPSLYACMLL
jgi:hypothetical protein